VIFEANLAGSLIAHFVAAASGSSLYRESSFLIGRLGTQVFAPNVRILEDPHMPGELASGYYDAEGVATAKRTVVDAGVLNGWFLSSYSGRKLGLASTGNAGGNHNLLIESGADDLAALLRRMGKGLLVTDLMGQGVNPVTGDYSRGAVGFWVEGGRIRFPVRRSPSRKPPRHVPRYRAVEATSRAGLQHRLHPHRPHDHRGDKVANRAQQHRRSSQERRIHRPRAAVAGIFAAGSPRPSRRRPEIIGAAPEFPKVLTRSTAPPRPCQARGPHAPAANSRSGFAAGELVPGFRSWTTCRTARAGRPHAPYYTGARIRLSRSTRRSVQPERAPDQRVAAFGGGNELFPTLQGLQHRALPLRQHGRADGRLVPQGDQSSRT
jgi:hypothetical protein